MNSGVFVFMVRFEVWHDGKLEQTIEGDYNRYEFRRQCGTTCDKALRSGRTVVSKSIAPR